MKLKQLVIVANVNYNSVRKWKQTYEDNFEKKFLVKKTQ